MESHFYLKCILSSWWNFDFSGHKWVREETDGEKQTIFCLTLCVQKLLFPLLLLLLFSYNVNFNRIICSVQNQRYKTNFAQDIRLEQWMGGNDWIKKPNRMKKIIAITATISVAIIRQLEMFSLLQTQRMRRKRRNWRGNFQFRCL